MALLDDARHVAIEEGHDERVDVRTIDIGIGHDDDLVVAKFVGVGLEVILAVNAKAHADALDDVHDRFGLKHPVTLHLLHVENLASEGKDGLVEAVASLLGRTACRVTLDEEDLGLLRVFEGAVGQFAGQSATTHHGLALHALASLAGGDARCGGEDHLVADHLGLVGVFLQIVGERLAYGLLYGTGHLAVAQLCFGLSLKLRLSHLDADHCGESFAEVLAGNLDFGLFDLLGDLRVVVGIVFQRAGEGDAEARHVGSAFYGVDVVDVGMEILRVIGVVHDGHFDGHALLFRLEIDHVVEEVLAVTVDIAHELLESVLGVKGLFARLPGLRVRALVDEPDGDACIEEGQFSHAVGHDVPFECRRGEDAGIGPKLLACAALIGVAHDFHGVERLSLFIFLLVDVAIAEHLGYHVCRECVDAADAHAVQAAADLVGSLVELTAGVEHCHHHFEGTLVELLVLVDGDATAVVLNGAAAVLSQGHGDVLAVSGHGLIDGVVHGLVDEVVETFLTDVANVHSRTLAHCFQTFQNLDVGG